MSPHPRSEGRQPSHQERCSYEGRLAEQPERAGVPQRADVQTSRALEPLGLSACIQSESVHRSGASRRHTDLPCGDEGAATPRGRRTRARRRRRCPAQVPHRHKIVSIWPKMDIPERVEAYLASQPEPKQADLRQLHALMLAEFPESRLWFNDGRNKDGKIVANPTS